MKRSLLIAAALAAAGLLVITNPTHAQPNEPVASAQPETTPAPDVPLPPGLTRIFDGKTLDGWIQEPLNATTLGNGDITDAAGLAKKFADRSDPVSAYIADQLDATAKTAITATDAPPTTQSTKDLKAALAKSLNQAVAGPSIYDEARFKDVNLRPETRERLKSNPQGRELARFNRVLLEDAYPTILRPTLPAAWAVKDGAMVSLGAGRGVIYTAKSFDRYRIVFDIRHAGVGPHDKDHQACVLVFCTAPTEGEKPMDALGGIQFQVPNGGHWDYRKGHNTDGKEEFTKVPHEKKFDAKEWSRVEILVDPAAGTGRMAVAQPVGSKAVEVVDFKDPTAGRSGPFALQMHNGGLFDEYANIAVEENPAGDELITTK